MSKEEKRVPEVRFKGFHEDWKQRKLGDISEKVTEKNKNKKFTETFTNSAEYGIVPQNDFFDKVISNSKNIGNYYIVQNDDFIYNPRISNFAPVGPIKRNKLNKIGIMSPLYYVFRTKNIDLTFLEKFFDTSYWYSFMKLNGDTGARADRFAIKDSVFKEMPIPYPSSNEQAKIGNLLKQIDNTIALHQEKITKLQALKKATLQSLLPEKDETEPKVRFANFSSSWKQRKLSNLVSVVRSYPLSRNVETEENTGTKYIHYGDIHTKKADKITSDSNIPNIKDGSYEYLEKGDLVLADASEDYQGIAMPSIIIETTSFSIVAGLHTITLRPKAIEPLYLYYLIHSSTFRKYGYKVGTGMKVFGISKNNILKFETLFPCIEEQTKISLLLNKIDNIIALHQIKLQNLQTLKKSFLQKMFI